MVQFTIKSKPIKPKRNTHIERSIDITTVITLEELLNIIQEHTIPLTASLKFNEYEMYIMWYESESDENYNARLTNYQKRLDEYNRWHNQNKDKINNIKKQKELQKLKKLESQKETLLKTLIKIEQEIKSI